MQFYHADYLKWSYNGIPYTLRQSMWDAFDVTYQRCSYKPKSFRDECLTVCDHLVSKYPNEQYWVYFSGGIDSEIVAECLRLKQIPFRIAIIEFEDNLNFHDVKWAFEYCDQWNIPCYLFRLDINRFIKEQQHIHYAKKYHSTQIAQQILMWLTDQIDGIPIMGHGDSFMHKLIDRQQYLDQDGQIQWKWYQYIRENNDFAIHRYSIVNNREMFAEFFAYTPEVLFSFLDDKLVHDTVEGKILGKISLYSIKWRIFQKYFVFKLRPKYHGFELLRRVNVMEHKRLRNMIPFNENIYKTEYNELLSELWHD